MDRRTFCIGLGAGMIGHAATVGATNQQASTPLVSTRGHFDIHAGSAYRRDGIGPNSYETSGGVPGIDTDCVDDLTVWIHGFKKDKSDVLGQLEELKPALSQAGYDGSATGFVWDSDQAWLEWWPTTDIARMNGLKLAAFTKAYREACPDGQLRFLAHSLGVTVAFSALEALATDAPEITVDSVALMGAAEEDQEPSLSCRYGSVLESNAGTVDNYWKSQDNLLTLFQVAELDGALGTNGIEGPPPNNYEDHKVDYVPSHEAYYDPDDGCIDDVVDNW